MTETLSTLKEEVPKIKEGLLDKYEKEPKKEVTKETTKLPKPTGWRYSFRGSKKRYDCRAKSARP